MLNPPGQYLFESVPDIFVIIKFKIMNKYYLFITSLFLLLSFPLLSGTGTLDGQGNPAAPPSPCEAFNSIFQDATGGFTKYRGDKHVVQGPMGETTYWDYSKAVWDPVSKTLYASSFGVSINLRMTYLQTSSLEEAKTTFNTIHGKLKSCMPKTYYLFSDHSKVHVLYVNYMDERDKDQFFEYEYPEIALSVKKSGTDYTVELTIFAGSEYAD